MKNFKVDYFNLILSIVNEITSELETAGLTEVTIFEGNPYEADIKSKDLPCFAKYMPYDEVEYQYIQKVIKCNGMWGIVVYDTFERETHFPKELNPMSLDFDCANNLYECVYGHIHRRKSPGDNQALEELKNTLGGE